MKHFLLIFLVTLLVNTMLWAQTATDLNEGLQVTASTTTPGAFTLSWYGKTGRTYFIQTSENLVDWTYVPVIESGSNAVIQWGFTSSEEAFFLKLRYTDASYTGPVGAADFDGDGWNNTAELLSNTNPSQTSSRPPGQPGSGGGLAGATNPTLDEMVEFETFQFYNSATGGVMYNSNLNSSSSVGTWYASWFAQNASGFDSVAGSPGNYIAARQQVLNASKIYRENALAINVGNAATIIALSYAVEVGGLVAGGGTSTSLNPYSEYYIFVSSYQSVRIKAKINLPAGLSVTLPIKTEIIDSGSSQPISTTTQLVTFDLPPGTVADDKARIIGTNPTGCEKLDGDTILLLCPDSPGIGTNTRRQMSLLKVAIATDSNMAGVIGDVVKSNQPSSSIKHFVTPKKSDELSQPYVELKADGLDVEQFTEFYEWEGGEAGSAVNKRRVKRDTAGKTEVKIKAKQGGGVVAEMHVWVVWCDSQPVGTIQPKATVINQPPIGAVTTVSGGLQFTHTIEPALIITDIEIPKLDGTKTKEPPGANHPLFNTDLKNGANNKWDASRQFRFKHTNPNNLPNDAFGQPAPLITVQVFPTNPVEGNDDAGISDEVPMPGGQQTGEMPRIIGPKEI